MGIWLRKMMWSVARQWATRTLRLVARQWATPTHQNNNNNNNSLAHHSNMVLFFKSSSSLCSSRTSSTTNNNYYHLRKRRKWPLSPYKAKWQETFDQQQAMETLKKQSSSTSTHLLSALINSFQLYNCDPTPNAYHFVTKTLTQTSQLHQLNQVLDRLQNVEKFQTPEYIFVDLINIYGNSNMVQQSIDLFFRIPSFRCTPSVYSLNSLLSVLCKKRQSIRLVPQILLESQSMNIRMEESTCQILIRALCRIKKADYAMKLLSYMVADEFSIDERMWSMILWSLYEQKDLSAVEFMRFLEEMRRLGFCLVRADWCTVIRFLVKRGKGKDALDALNQMKMDGVKPDVKCYTMVLDGVVAEGNYDKADELFDEMLVLGLVPDICTYNLYIKGLCKQNKLEEGIKMLACMEDLGCKPDLVTYNTLLEGLYKVGELSRTRELVRDMELKGIQLNSTSYGIIIDGLIKEGGIDEACVLWKEMWDRCLIPLSSTFDEIICGLCQRGLAGNALDLIKETLGENVAPGVRAWEALLLSSGVKPCLDTVLMDSIDPVQTDIRI